MRGNQYFDRNAHADHWIGEDRHVIDRRTPQLHSKGPRLSILARCTPDRSRLELEEVSPVLARGTKWSGAVGAANANWNW